MKKIIPVIMLVLLVSGCTDPNKFCLFNCDTVVKELPPDVLVIQNVRVLPTPPIIAGEHFSIYFEVNNQEEERYVDYAAYSMLDSGLCERVRGDKTGEFANVLGGKNAFSPKETVSMEWNFAAPSANELVRMDSKCPIRFNVSYNFSAISEMEIDVLSVDKFNEMQQQGEFTPYTPAIFIGRGPMKVGLEFGVTQPVKSGSVVPIYITAEDRGTGLYSNIAKKEMHILIPNDFKAVYPSPLLTSCGERFECIDDGKYNDCYNKVPIMMIDRKSPTIACSFSTPSVSIEKVYTVEAYLNYTYDINHQVDVDIKTLKGVR